MLKGKFRNKNLMLRKEILILFRRYSIPRWFVFTFDVLAVFVTFLFAYLLRFNFVSHDFIISHACVHSVIALVIYALSFLIFRPFSGLIRHTTLTDISLVFAATTVSVVILTSISLITRYLGAEQIYIIPISIILIHYGIVTILLFAVRLAIKLLFRIATKSVKYSQNVLIYGAGRLGFSIKRYIMNDPKSQLRVIGFLDDNKQLHGKKVNGIPVIDPALLNKEYVEKRKIKNLILAIENLPADKKKELISFAIDVGLTMLKTTSAGVFRNTKTGTENLEKINIEDLLEQGPNLLNHTRIRNGIKGKTVLVTGAAGSIGQNWLIRFQELNRKKLSFWIRQKHLCINGND